MTNSEILDAISKLQYVVSSREEGMDEIAASANAQIKVLMAKLDFDSTTEPKLAKTKQEVEVHLGTMSKEEIFMLMDMLHIKPTIIGKAVQQSTIGKGDYSIEGLMRTNEMLQAENIRLQSAFDSCSKELNEVNAKIQNGELVERAEWQRKFEESNNWRNAYYDMRNLILVIESKWYFRLFGNLPKIQREIALEKAINENM